MKKTRSKKSHDNVLLKRDLIVDNFLSLRAVSSNIAIPPRIVCENPWKTKLARPRLVHNIIFIIYAIPYV